MAYPDCVMKMTEDQFDRLFEECMKYGVLGEVNEAQQWWNTLSDDEKEVVQTLPDFDEEVYNKCIGKFDEN